MADVKLSKADKDELLTYLCDYVKNIPDNDINEIDKKLEEKVQFLLKRENVPSFISKMIAQVNDLKLILKSSIVAETERSKALAALHYFIWAEDGIPDYIPVVGFLDDAFVISVVHHDVRKAIHTIKFVKAARSSY